MTWSSGTYWGATTNTGTYLYPVVTSGSSSVSFGAQYVPTAPQSPREPTAMEWLDAEVEATCALARAA